MRHLIWSVQSNQHQRAINARQGSHGHGQAFPLHSHDYYEIFVVLGGKLEHHWDSNKQTLEAGDAIALIPGESHKGINKQSAHVTILNISAGAQAVHNNP